MKYICAFTFAIFLIPLFASAQSNYKPGYVINLKGDTLKGFINYKEWSQNPSSIDFKTDVADKSARKFTTDDIKFFKVIGFESYQKFTGPIGTDSTDPAYISFGKDTTFKVASVFLKILTEGKNLILLSYLDDVRPHFYIEEAPVYAPKELVYHIYKENDKQTDAVKTKVDNEYVTQLYFSAQKYNVLTPGLQQDLEHSGYNADDLMKVVSTINGVSKEDFKKEHIHDTQITPFVSGGIDVSAINPFDRYKNSGGKSSTSIFPAIGVGMTISTHADPKIQFLVEGMFSGNKYQSIYIYTNSPFVPVKYSFDQLWFAATPQVEYNFYNAPDLKVFLGVGIALTFNDYYNGKYDLDYAATKVTGATLAGKGFFHTFTTPLLFKAGARINKRLEVFASYFTNSTVSTEYYFQVHFNNIQSGINYYFK